MRLPADICRCHNKICADRLNCARWVQRDSGADYTPHSVMGAGCGFDQTCEYFIPEIGESDQCGTS